MFNKELPEFYRNDAMGEFFVENINDLFSFKNNDYFHMDALEEFIKVSDDLENSLLEFTNFTRQKVDYFERLRKKFEKNTETLRDLNEQHAVVKMQQSTFSSIHEPAAVEVDEDALNL